MNIELTSATYRVTAIVKKTKANLFQDIRVGDLIRFESTLKYAGRASRGAYASYVSVVNVTQGTSATLYVSEVSARVSCFEIETADDNA